MMPPASSFFLSLSLAQNLEIYYTASTKLKVICHEKFMSKKLTDKQLHCTLDRAHWKPTKFDLVKLNYQITHSRRRTTDEFITKWRIRRDKGRNIWEENYWKKINKFTSSRHERNTQYLHWCQISVELKWLRPDVFINFFLTKKRILRK